MCFMHEIVMTVAVVLSVLDRYYGMPRRPKRRDD
jgi:hypothetical protein